MKFSLHRILDLKKDRNSFPSDSLDILIAAIDSPCTCSNCDSRRTQLGSYLLAILVVRSRSRDLKVAQTATLKGKLALVYRRNGTNLKIDPLDPVGTRSKEEERKRGALNIPYVTILPDLPRSFESKESNLTKRINGIKLAEYR